MKSEDVLDFVEASAPSNIALIKYMGKIEGTGNKPANASLSYTLESLRTFVRLTPINGGAQGGNADTWSPLGGPGLIPLELSQKGQERFLKHFAFLKNQWGIEGQYWKIESANNFPSDCGLASSASSFAALTLAAAKAFQQISPKTWGHDLQHLSSLSRQGSGSSCRSLFGPWALWKEEYAEPALLEYTKLHHMVILVEDGKKEVSSSEAHKRVTSSPRFEGRIERAHMRLNDLVHALRFGDWAMGVQICWDEFIDMHRLFETSVPSFSYMTEGSRAVIEHCEKEFKKWGDGPLVTMDAGANVHLLFRNDDFKRFENYKKHFESLYQVTATPYREEGLN